jgi:hypothetical protein
VLVGAVVNGPNGAENFEDIGIPDGARACPVDGRNRFAAFDRPDARFLDDVRAWPSVEPAIDFTSTGMLALRPVGHALTLPSCRADIALELLLDGRGGAAVQSQPSVVAARSRVAATPGSPSTRCGTESGSRRLPSR